MRGRLIDGPLTPFFQLGLGQWRVDPDMPSLPHEVILAGQAGVGAELALRPGLSIALVVDCTLLQPEHATPPEPDQVRAAESRGFAGQTGHTGLASSAQGQPERGDVGGNGGATWLHPPAFWGAFLAARATF
jgi:hypothetical protein